MIRLVFFVFCVVSLQSISFAKECPETLDFRFRTLAGETEKTLCEEYAGKVLLIVNTASKCGFTPQYDGLEALYDHYRERGLVVLGFPSNDFAQELSSEQEIQQFCRLTYSIEFPMFEKTHVAEGAVIHPFFKKLGTITGNYPQWNFHKYLIDRNGEQVKSFATRTKPDDPKLIKAIEEWLQ